MDLAGGKASIVSLLRTVLRFVQPHQLTGLKINSQFQMPDILELRFGFKRGDVSFPHVQQIGRTDPRRLRERQRMPVVALIKELTAVQKSRRETRPTRASKERRLASKAQKSSVKALRGKVRQ